MQVFESLHNARIDVLVRVPARNVVWVLLPGLGDLDGEIECMSGGCVRLRCSRKNDATVGKGFGSGEMLDEVLDHGQVEGVDGLHLGVEVVRFLHHVACTVDREHDGWAARLGEFFP